MRILILMMCLGLSACSGLDIESASKCHELADLSCSLTTECGATQEKYNCIAGFNAGIAGGKGTSCQDADGVASEAAFTECTSELRRMIQQRACGGVDPESCRGLIRFD